MANADYKKAYGFHGVSLIETSGNQLKGTCPFCGKEKLYVSVETGKWDCKVCDGSGGNLVTFLRKLWSKLCTPAPLTFCQSRSTSREVADEWGCRLNPLNKRIVIPGKNLEGGICQLYKYTKVADAEKYILLATPSLSHYPLYGKLNETDTIYLCEGPWDGMAIQDILSVTKVARDGSYEATGSVKASLLQDVIAVPGAGVFSDKWTKCFSGKKVVLMYDHDEAGLNGAKRTTGILSAGADGPPTSIHWLKWPSETPNKTDVRDIVTERGRPGLKDLLTKYAAPIPSDWIKGRSHQAVKSGKTEVELIKCESYNQLLNEFRKAIRMTYGLDCALSVMLSAVVSTGIPGDQIWVQIIGPPSCGKSTLCEALSTNKNWIKALSTIRGFHSGFRDAGEGTENKSLILKLKNKTLVTKDGDTLLTAPNKEQILAEARDLYDRTARSDYRNGMGLDHEGVSVTWILCGTAALHSLDTSELGARFVKCVVMDEIDDVLEDEILWRVANRTNRIAVASAETNSDGGVADNKLARAMRATGGFIDWLRAGGALAKFESIETPEHGLRHLIGLAKLTAYMRARPSKLQSEHVEREFAARLVGQYVRLAKCLAVVLGKQSLADEDVLNRVTKVALDTCAGRVLQITKLLADGGGGEEKRGVSSQYLAVKLGRPDNEVRNLLRFMEAVKAVYRTKTKSGVKWYLADNLLAIIKATLPPSR